MVVEQHPPAAANGSATSKIQMNGGGTNNEEEWSEEDTLGYFFCKSYYGLFLTTSDTADDAEETAQAFVQLKLSLISTSTSQIMNLKNGKNVVQADWHYADFSCFFFPG